MSELRKLAAEVIGRTALEERFAQPQLSALDAVLLEKVSSTDPELLRVADALGTDKILDVYEQLGGDYSKVKE